MTVCGETRKALPFSSMLWHGSSADIFNVSKIDFKWSEEYESKGKWV